jgi:3-oxoacyl-[acyl-carrier-protein] synthase II
LTKRRVVITGLGVIAPNGIGKKAFWKALKEGKSGIVKITRFDTSSYPSQIAGEVNDFEPTDYMSPKTAKRTDKFVQFAVAAARMAVEDSQLAINNENARKIGIIMGSALGGTPLAEFQHAIFMEKGLNRVDPLLAIKIFSGGAPSQTSIELGIKGPCYSISTACTAGTDAIGYALTLIRNDVVDICISGGAEAPIAPLTFGAFCRIGALSRGNSHPQKASRPFDRNRDGFVMSEGAGILVLEELQHALKRNAHIYAELIGFGATSDAFHMVKTPDDAEETVEAIRLALQDANIDANDIDYINAHGTSTPLNDKIETLAFKKVFGRRAYKIPISSTKSMIGHTLGGTGGIEAIVSALSIENEFIHPTINYETPDPDCDLNYVPNKGIKAKVNLVLSNSLGFGSRNAALILKKH